MASPSRDGVVQRRQQAQSGRRIGSTSSSNSKGKGWSLSTRYSPHVGHTDCSLSPVTSNTSSWTNYLKDFVTQCKGLEEGRHSTRMTTPVTEQGMGLYQQFWAIKKRYVAVIQRPLSDPNARCNPWGQHEVLRSSNPISYYWCITRQLEAMTGISCLQPPWPVLSAPPCSMRRTQQRTQATRSPSH